MEINGGRPCDLCIIVYDSLPPDRLCERESSYLCTTHSIAHVTKKFLEFQCLVLLQTSFVSRRVGLSLILHIYQY